MDDDDLAGVLLSRFAGICEDLSTVAVQVTTSSDPAAIAAIKNQLVAASTLLDAIAVLVPGGMSR